MKQLIMSVAITLFCGNRLAAEVFTLTAINGDVKFSHKIHQQLLKNCKLCHA